MDQSKIKDILVAQHYVSADDMRRAENEAPTRGLTPTDFLIAEDVLSKDLLGQAIAESMNVGYADLNSRRPLTEQIMKIPEEIARKHRAIVFDEHNEHVTIASDMPLATGITGEIPKLFPGKTLHYAYSLPEDIDSVLASFSKPLEVRFGAIIQSKKRVAPEIIEELIVNALDARASDIHIEPQERDVTVRFRIDGVLHMVGTLPREYYENILNHIKVRAKLRIDEHFSAQDGAIRFSQKGKNADLRISILPTIDGEKVAIRMLTEYVRGLALTDLGFSVKDQIAFEKSARKPFGMIIVTGPTGSGKTTTLYSLLKLLQKPEVNITTIEDPVEYRIAGINQVQVSIATNLTFAKGLRSIVRQDPNIILVGEIRDRETAEIAVNAALTGHLLLSTFHANDASSAIPRLLDMGAEPFLVASTLELIVAQRLLRRICEHCRYSYSVVKDDIPKLFTDAQRLFGDGPLTLYRGKGCATCGQTGYRGRIAIFEIMQMTPEQRALVLARPSSPAIREVAKRDGMRPLFEDGLEKAKNGVTTIDEVLRVADMPELSPSK